MLNNNNKNQRRRHLPLQAVKDVAAPDVPLLAATRQSRSAVDKPVLIHTEHAHLGHCADKGSIPRALAECEGVEGEHSKRVLSDALVSW